jgi:acetylornithine deacetylase/succinyl-diaminopimelate desuccinylase-like protein
MPVETRTFFFSNRLRSSQQASRVFQPLLIPHTHRDMRVWHQVVALAAAAVALCAGASLATAATGTAANGALAARLARVEADLRSHSKKAVDDLAAWVRIPSISALPDHARDIDAAAAWVAAKLKASGLGNVTTLRQGASPAVFGEWLGAGDAALTVLIYGHGDVQPADAATEDWHSPPFEPVVKGGIMYGRGASDDKGGALGAIEAVRAWVSAGGGPPVNVKVYIEFQEEVGSPDMGPFLAAHRDLLASDVALSADGSQPGEDVGATVLGLRGAAAFEVRVRTLAGDVHSGSFGGSVQNAAAALAAAIGSLHDSKGRVAMRGFYGGVAPPTRSDLAAVAEYEGSSFFDAAEDLASLGASAPVGERGYSTLARRWLRPTCDVVGAASGFTGDGIKTIVPATGAAKVACRLVPAQTPDGVLAVARRHFEGGGFTFPGAAFEVVPLSFKAVPYRMAPAAPAAAATRAVLASLMPHVFTSFMGGSIPATAWFKQALGVDTSLLAFGTPGDRVHAPNEQHKLSQFTKCQVAFARVLAELAQPGLVAKATAVGERQEGGRKEEL